MKKFTKKPNVLVIGDLMIDYYFWGKCEHISPEAPIQVVDVNRESSVLGGAGNVINNLNSLGANVDVMSVIGDDPAADLLKKLLTNIKVSTEKLIVERNRKTSTKNRIYAGQQQLMRYDIESLYDISEESQNSIIENLKKNISKYNSIILSDYKRGVLTDKLTQNIIKIANDHQVKVLVDPKGKDYTKYKGAFTLTPNKLEAMEATNIEINDNESLNLALTTLKEQCKLEVSMITLSEEGIAFLNKNLVIQESFANRVCDVTGAGDSVIAALAFSIGNGCEFDEAVHFANLAAAVVIGKLGTATTTLDEIYDYEESLLKPNSKNHIKTFDEIRKIVRHLKNKGKTIVFTNGCFDILHVGHIQYLEEAKSYGDVLIVGLNADVSVRKLKGETRPIYNQKDRSHILSSLSSVDYVVIFEEETPYELIRVISPDILVKGGDYEGKEVIGMDIAKETKLMKLVNGKSTTETIKQIQNGANS